MLTTRTKRLDPSLIPEEELTKLAKVFAKPDHVALIDAQGNRTHIPEALFNYFARIVRLMSEKTAIVLIPENEAFTTPAQPTISASHANTWSACWKKRRSPTTRSAHTAESLSATSSPTNINSTKPAARFSTNWQPMSKPPASTTATTPETNKDRLWDISRCLRARQLWRVQTASEIIRTSPPRCTALVRKGDGRSIPHPCQ